MAQTIRLKRQPQSGSAAVGIRPTTAMLLDGELAINTVDGKLFLKKTPATGSPSIVEVGANPFPTQAGYAGKFLQTDGTAVSWATPGTVSAAAIDITQSDHGFTSGTILYHDGSTYKRAQANSVTTADVIGIVTNVISTDKFTLTTNGFVNMYGQPGWTDGAWVPGQTYYLSATAAGTLTNVEPIAAGEISKPLLVAINSTAYSATVPNSGGPRGFFYNWRGISNEIPTTDIDALLPPQSSSTIGKSLTSSPSGAIWSSAGGSGSGGSNSSITVSQAGHNLVVGELLRYDGTQLMYVRARADNGTNADVVGIVSEIVSADEFIVTTQGIIAGLAGLTAGTSYFLSDTAAGALSATEPTTLGSISKPVLIATGTTSGLFVNMRGIGISVLDSTHEVASQTGNSGKFLTTNGTTTSWGTPVTTFNTRSGNVTLTSADVTTALAYTPYNATNPSGYLTASSGVASFNTRQGAVSLLAGDLSALNVAFLASPTFTGAPKAPTPVFGSNDTSVATTAYAQAMFSGRVLANPGYQMLPGGLIMQWGTTTIPGSGSGSFTFPIVFPNAVLCTQITKTGSMMNSETVNVVSSSNANVILENFPGAAETAVSVFVIGY